MEGTQGGSGDQSRALCLRFVAGVWERGLQELLWSHTPLLTFLHPSLCSQLWDPSKPKVSKPPGFIKWPPKALLNPQLGASSWESSSHQAPTFHGIHCFSLQLIKAFLKHLIY